MKNNKLKAGESFRKTDSTPRTWGFWLLATFLLTFGSMFAQTTLVSSTAGGGFEVGTPIGTSTTDFNNNGWTVVNGANNPFWVNNTPVPSAGSFCAFTGNSWTSWVPSASGSVSHIYRDVAVPIGENNLTTTIRLKMSTTDPTYDYTRVYIVPTATTPVAGTLLGSGQVGSSVDGTTSYATYTFSGAVVPLTTVRVVISFRTDGFAPACAVAMDEISIVSSVGPQTYYSKAAATDFTATGSWGINLDGSGASPSSISNADSYVIANGSAMNLNSGNASVRNLTISNGSLAVASNTLTVSLPTGNTSLCDVPTGGTLNVSGTGTVNIRGRLSVSGTGALTQSGGNISVDGNDGGAAATSVPSGTAIVSFTSSTLNLTGGTFTIVDPHANSTTSLAFDYNVASISYNCGAGHTFRFGNGVSTDAGGSTTGGFRHSTFTGFGRFNFGNLTVDALAGTNRFITFVYGHGIDGNLTINSGDYRNISTFTTIYVAGNVTVTSPGILTSGNTSCVLALSRFLSGTVSPSVNAQTISGTGTFRNLVTSPTACFTGITVNNTNPSGVTFSGNALSGTGTGTVSGALTITAGLITAVTNPFILGTSITVPGTLSWTSGGFAPGSAFRRWVTTSSITVSATASSSFFPFANGTSSRMVRLNRNTGATNTAGWIQATHTHLAGLVAAGSFADAGYTVDRRTNASWSFTTSGFSVTGNLNVGVCGEGVVLTAGTPGAGAPLDPPRFHQSGVAAGTHLTGSGTNTAPFANRTIALASLIAGPNYIGVNTNDLGIESQASGPWESTSTWNTGSVPTSAQSPLINVGHTVTVNGAAAAALNLTINGTLDITGNTLNVTGASATGITVNNGGVLTVNGGTVNIGPQDNSFCNRRLSLLNGSTLNVTTGTLNLAGNLATTSGMTINQSGGNFNIDGNANAVALNSTAAVLCDLNIANLSSVNFTGGTLTFVDPPIAAVNTIRLNGTVNGSVNVTPAHTIVFGDGTSTTDGGASAWNVDTWVATSGMHWGNLVVNGPAGTNRFLTSTYQQPVRGDLTINAGGECRIASVYVRGNVVNNGTLTSTTTLGFNDATFLNGGSLVFTAATSAQSIGGSGTFRNLTAAPTANLTGITVQNTSVGGVTMNLPLTMSGGNLILTDGKLNTTSTNMLTILTAGANVGPGTTTIGYVNGPVRRTFAASSTNVQGMFPVGKTQANWMGLFNLTTNAGGPVTIEIETNNSVALPSGFGSSLQSLNAGREWVTTIVSGAANLDLFSVQGYDAAMVSGNALAKIKAPETAFEVLGTGGTWNAAVAPQPPFIGINLPQIAGADFPDRIGFGQTGPLDVSTISATHSVTSAVSTNSTNNRILRVIVSALGSSGSINLSDLTFTYSGSNAADIAANGVKLWRGTFDNPVTQIGTGQSLGGGQAIFTGLVEPINSGNNFFWITLDVDAAATIGNNIDGFINSGDMLFDVSGGATAIAPLPASIVDPVGNRLIDYCVPTYTIGCDGGVEGISNVSLGTLNNTSGCPAGPAFYTYFNLVTPPNLEQGITYPISITVGSDGSNFNRVWVDFNKNGVFETGESFSGGTSPGSNGTSTFNIVVPGGATLGNTRMRVRGGEDNAILNTQACGASSSGFGETEDYIVNITSPTPKSITAVTATQQTGGMGISTGNNNLLRVNIDVAGSAGTQTLNSIQFNYTGVSSTDIAALGATLWSGNASTPTAQIGPGLTISANLMNFTSLATVLNPGTNYFWLRVNTSATAVIPNIVDASISAGDVVITASGGATAPGTLPAALVNPAGERFIDYCTPIYSTGCTGSDRITAFSINTLSNASGTACSTTPPGYISYPIGSFTTTLVAGTSYTANLSIGTGGAAGVAIFIDYNQNGVFETSERSNTATNIASGGSGTVSVAVPVTSLTGTVRMRVRHVYNTAGNTIDPCNSYTWGETEDYTITINPPPNCSTLLPFPATAATASATTVCTGTSINFGLSVAMPIGAGITYQWRRNAVNIGSPVSTTVTPLVVTASGNYDVVVRCNGTPQVTSTAIAITVNSPTVTPGANQTRCGTGTANLFAAIGGGATQIRWYDLPSGGSVIGTGSPFTTPSISANTTYYVAAASLGTPVNGGKPNCTEGGGFQGTNYGIVFNATDPFTLNSLDIYPGLTAGTVTIQVQNSSGVLIPGLTGTYAFPAGDFNTPHTISLGFDIPAGTGLRLVTSALDQILGRDFTVSYPYAIGAVGSVTSGFNGTITGGAYYYFYNLNVTGSCVSARQPMTVTVTAPPALNLNSVSETICNGASTPSIILSGQANYSTFSWSPSVNVTPNNAAGPYVFNPSASGTYTLTATSGAGCVSTKTITINVNPIPTTGTATITTNPICEGSALALNAGGFTSAPVPLLTQGFESGLGAWSVTALSTGGTLPAVANFAIQPHGYTLDARIWNSPGGTNFIISDADAAGDGVTLETYLTSPSFSTLGASSATLGFRYGTAWGGDRIVEGSIDGGVTWPFTVFTNTTGTNPTSGAMALISASASLPAGMINQPNVQIRFNHTGGWDGTWAIDDIVISASSISYAWSGPNAYTASTQNPSIAGATPTNNGVYTVIATNLANCTATASTAAAVVNPTPVAFISPATPHTIATTGCPVTVGFSKSPSGSIIAATATGGTISWAENGAGNFTAGGTTASPTYTPAAGDAGNTVTLTLTVTPPAPCTPVTATYTIQFRSAPTIQVDDVNEICTVGNPYRILSVTSPINPAYEYVWPSNDLYLDPSFTIPYIAGTNATTVYSVPFGTQVYAVTERDPITNCAVSSSNITVSVCATLTASICAADASPLITAATGLAFTQYTLLAAATPLNTGVACGMPVVDLVRDAFYKVTVPASGEIHVTTAPGTNANPLLRVQRSFVQILVGADCLTTSIQGCDRGGAAGLHSYAYATGLNPGQTAYVRIASVADIYTSPTAGASSVGTTVTVSSTTGLAVGMTVTVIGGTGSFPAGTIVSNIISATQFEVSQVPSGFTGTTVIKGSRANPEQNSIGIAITDAMVWTGAANTDFFNPLNWVGGDASALTVPAGNKSVRVTRLSGSVPQPALSNNYVSAAGATFVTTTVTVASTVGLRAGMVVRVSAGAGSFPAGTTVRSIISATQFTVNNIPVGFSGTTVIEGFPAVRNLYMGTNAAMSIASNSSLGVYNNLNGNSNVIAGPGYVNLIGITEQQFDGPLSMHNLAIDNPAGAKVNSTVRVGPVRLINGPLTTQNNFTIISAGYLDNFSAGYTGFIVGNLNIERSLGRNSHYVSSPVTNAGSVFDNYNDDVVIAGNPSNYVFSTDPALPQAVVFPTAWYWDETITDPYAPGWTNARAISLAAGQGISLNAGATPKVIDNLGVPNNGNISRAITNTAADGFNLVGNPYPSTMRFTDLYNANSSLIAPIMYIWNPVSNNYAAYSIGGGGVWVNNPVGGANDHLGHSQGFYVVASTSGNLNFTNAMRTTNPASTFFSTPTGVIRLQVSGNGYSDETVVMTQSNSTENYDDMIDAKKLMNNITPTIQLFTLSNNNTPLAINAMDKFSAEQIIPLQVISPVAGEVNIKLAVEELSGIYEDIYLEDAASGTFTNLKAQGSYRALVGEGNSGSRFFLHFAKPTTTTAVATELNVYSANNTVFVNLPSESNGTIEVVDMAGKTIYTSNFNGKSGRVSFEIPNAVYGTYLVKLSSNGKVMNQKVILNQ
jgi:hypothetical protein